MQDAGAALSTSNNSLEKSVAMWTAMNEILQDGSKSSTALRFIAQRMRNTAGELEEMGVDADGAAESVTKLQQQILKMTGVNLMASPTEFRDTYDVLQDISKVWNDITDKDQADVIRLLAGVRQSSAFSSLMTNWSTAEEALQVGLEATGSAARENAKWLDSIEAKQQQAKASFQAFSNAILDSDLIKFTYDAGTGILGFLTKITETIGALPLLSATAAAALSFKNKGISNRICPILPHG